MSLESVSVHCPYCGEMVEVDVEQMEEVQSFIEDCSVCCRPMQLEARPNDEEGTELIASRSD